MKKIESFKIDHRLLKPGIYVSRVEQCGNCFITTFDIRVKEPKKYQYIPSDATHTIEHICATYFRTESYLRNNVVYFGPMGCLTGFYLVLKNKKPFLPENVWWEVSNAFKKVVEWEGEIPGATEEECGNYLLHNLEGAKEHAKEFCKYLSGGLNEVNSQYPITRIGIVVAMEQEAKMLECLDFVKNNTVKIVVTGIGKVNAALATERLINEYSPQLVIAFGYSGGVPHEGLDMVKLHDVVVATTAKYHDVWCGDGEELGRIQGFPKEYTCKLTTSVLSLANEIAKTHNQDVVYGGIGTGDKLVKKEELDFITGYFPEIIAVDMESAAVAQTCFTDSVTFASVRIVSDMIGAEDQSEQYTKSVKTLEE